MLTVRLTRPTAISRREARGIIALEMARRGVNRKYKPRSKLAMRAKNNARASKKEIIIAQL